PSLGALLIGLFVSCCLFGVSTVQTYKYYTRFPDDRARLKIMVTVIWFCELGHYICISDTVYNLAVTHFGDPSVLLKISLSTIIAVFCGVYRCAVILHRTPSHPQ
ncbi:hypothetical protein CPB84DRAFT_1802678, partial [Gymnopilus junonius]